MTFGLDFGTTNTLVSKVENGFSSNIILEKEFKTIPSTAFFPSAFGFAETHPNYNKIEIGTEAIDSYIGKRGGRFMKSFKKILGSNFYDNGTMLRQGVKLDFEDLFVHFLKEIKNRVETRTQIPFDNIVAGIPVEYCSNKQENEKAKSRYRNILRKIGVTNLRLEYEPYAAAVHHMSKLNKKGIVVVADLGGGTCDFTVINYDASNKADILISSGIALGGADYDGKFALNSFYKELGYKSINKFKGLIIPDTPYRDASDWNRINNSFYLPKTYMLLKKMIYNSKESEKVKLMMDIYEGQMAHGVLGEMERIKIDLSNKEFSSFNYPNLNLDSSLEFDSSNFNASTENITERISETLKNCLKEVGIDGNKVDHLIFAGGTSNLGVLKMEITSIMPNANFLEENKMDSVSLGLGILSNTSF